MYIRMKTSDYKDVDLGRQEVAFKDRMRENTKLQVEGLSDSGIFDVPKG